jgi:hypothetical protein
MTRTYFVGPYQVSRLPEARRLAKAIAFQTRMPVQIITAGDCLEIWRPIVKVSFRKVKV